MKSFKDFLNESLETVNEAKQFNYNDFDKQVQAVDKFFKNKSKLNKWAENELGGEVEDDVYDGIEQIMDVLRGWEDNLDDRFDDANEDDEWKDYKELAYVESSWAAVWSAMAEDDFGDNAEAIATVLGELWPYVTKKQFPFEFDA